MWYENRGSPAELPSAATVSVEGGSITASDHSAAATIPVTLYSLVAWPSGDLDGWLRREQGRLGVRAYGDPHLNLRAPFGSSLPVAVLVASFRELLAGVRPFEVEVQGWRVFPGIVFLECVLSPELLALHDLALTLPEAPPQPYDRNEYIPHLTLALGVLPWARAALNSELERMTWPVTHFPVSALSLTRETGGEVQEVHTFPLAEERG